MRFVTTVRPGMRSCVFLFLIAGAGSASAQVDSFADLRQVVKKGQVVFVEDEKGERVEGNITELSDSSLQLMTTGVGGREVTIAANQVTRVSKADSRVNGFLIGAVAGVIPGLYFGYLVNTYCNNESADCRVAYPLFGGLLGLAGGGIGYAIDGAIDGQQLVYTRRGPASDAAVHVAPMVGRQAGGVRLSIRF